MKPDINSREDIKSIVTLFYDKMISDEVLYPFFEELVKSGKLKHHLNIITDFWEDVLFDTTKYYQNLLKKHLNKNAFVKFKKEHFKLWLYYFKETIDDAFEGLKAVMMKNRAESIATVMQLKMNVY